MEDFMGLKKIEDDRDQKYEELIQKLQQEVPVTLGDILSWKSQFEQEVRIYKFCAEKYLKDYKKIIEEHGEYQDYEQLLKKSKTVLKQLVNIKNKNSKKEAILIYAYDWEGLFVGGHLKYENHTLNEGKERITYFLELADKYNFNIYDLKFATVTSEYIEILEEKGGFHKKLSDVSYIIND